jgi:hypothetical protein
MIVRYCPPVVGAMEAISAIEAMTVAKQSVEAKNVHTKPWIIIKTGRKNPGKY